MSGKYLRKIVPGAPRDPTMTHVPDPWTFKVGDVLRDMYEYHQITQIDDNVFDNADIRFAHLRKIEAPPDGVSVHDLRDDDRETWRLNTFNYVVR